MSVKGTQKSQVAEYGYYDNDTVEIRLMNDLIVCYGFNKDEALFWESGLRPKEMVKITDNGDSYGMISRG